MVSEDIQTDLFFLLNSLIMASHGFSSNLKKSFDTPMEISLLLVKVQILRVWWTIPLLYCGGYELFSFFRLNWAKWKIVRWLDPLCLKVGVNKACWEKQKMLRQRMCVFLNNSVTCDTCELSDFIFSLLIVCLIVCLLVLFACCLRLCVCPNQYQSERTPS